MSYQGPKPFGRRRTDKPLSEEERLRLQSIRRDVDEDPTGQIRRYLRLAAKALESEENGSESRNYFPGRGITHTRKNHAA